MKNCKECGHPIEGNTSIKSFCNKECRRVFWNRYRKDYRNKPENIERFKEMVRNSMKKRRLNPMIRKMDMLNNYKWREKNPERWKILKKNDYLKHQDRVKMARYRRKTIIRKIKGTMPSMEIVLKRMSLFSGCCFCGDQIPLTIEHLTPISKGGTNEELNIFGSCKKCNSSKQDADWKVWFRSRSFYNPEREILITMYSKIHEETHFAEK